MMQEDDSAYILGGHSRRHSGRRCLLYTAVAVGLVALSLGIVIGYFGRALPEGPCLGPDVSDKITEDADPEITAEILKNIRADNIQENLERWSSFPHMAGTPGSDRMAQEVYKAWTAQGLDRVVRRSYDVLLSKPNAHYPSVVHLVDDTGNVNFSSQVKEPALSPNENMTDVPPSFNAFSPAGNVTGELVYVNYGQRADFKKLVDMKVDVSGKIVIARYGQIFRGQKVELAASYGAVGCILYSDPADCAQGNETYPKSWWMPPTGIQRGTVLSSNGDPLTPGYPATPRAYRLNETHAGLPTIPVHPISYADAQNFLGLLGGAEAPDEWQGGLPLKYHIGPGFNDTHANWTVNLKTTTATTRVNITNVLGFIKGSVEPDRYVLLSNHRDAWVFGAVDPTSGTAVMAEVSRVFMDIVRNKGWRPRRTIVFASWDAEEFGLVGSVEWVENYMKTLADRTVALLNVDLAIQGSACLRVKSVPLLYSAIYRAAFEIPSPNDADKTLYDEWNDFRRVDSGVLNGHPLISPLGSGSDFTPFLAMAGISAMDVRYDKNDSLSSYPLYHSAHENFNLVKTYMDPDFRHMEAVGKFWGEMSRYLADSLFLPLNASFYAEALKEFTANLFRAHDLELRKYGVTSDDMNTAVEDFSVAAKNFHTRMSGVNHKNPLLVRHYNDQLMRLERAFTDPAGLPRRPLYKHVLFGPSRDDSYHGDVFPGLLDLLSAPEGAEEEIKKHVASITFAIEAATAILLPETEFSG